MEDFRNVLKEVKPVYTYEGEKFYEIRDPDTGNIIEDYFISKSGKVLSIKTGIESFITPHNGTVSLRLRPNFSYNYNINVLLVNTFLTEVFAREKYRVKGILFTRKYKGVNDWYVVSKDGIKDNCKLSNVDRLTWKQYKDYCKKFQINKAGIKPQDKNLIKEIKEATGYSDRKLGTLFNISSGAVFQACNGPYREKSPLMFK